MSTGRCSPGSRTRCCAGARGWAAPAGPTASSAALLLREEGRFALNDPIEHYLPQLGRRRVLTI